MRSVEAMGLLRRRLAVVTSALHGEVVPIAQWREGIYASLLHVDARLIIPREQSPTARLSTISLVNRGTKHCFDCIESQLSTGIWLKITTKVQKSAFVATRLKR